MTQRVHTLLVDSDLLVDIVCFLIWSCGHLDEQINQIQQGEMMQTFFSSLCPSNGKGSTGTRKWRVSTLLDLIETCLKSEKG